MSNIKGRFRWCVIALIALATVINYIDRNALAIMWPGISQDLGMDKSQYAFIVSCFTIAYAISQALMARGPEGGSVGRVVADVDDGPPCAQGGDQRFGQCARVHARRFGQHHGSIGGQIAVAGIAWRFHRHVGKRQASRQRASVGQFSQCRLQNGGIVGKQVHRFGLCMKKRDCPFPNAKQRVRLSAWGASAS